MELSDFWPPVDDDHTGQCLFTEAETADREVFLAVHQPMQLEREWFNASEPATVCSENELLDAFLVPEPTSGTLILPIIGDSGVGKSHMIRWLDAHLRLRPDADTRHIVRIPKSSSLPQVLRLILQDLPGSQYDELRESLTTAKLPPTLLEATRLLQAKLLIGLKKAGIEAKSRINEGNAKPEDKARRAHCSDNGLIALLQEPEVQSHFTNYEGDEENWGVLARFADRAINGNKKNDNEFLPKDFDFIQEVETANLGPTTRTYLSPLKAKPENVVSAIKFLNEVMDEALGGLVDMGGESLTEMFVDIRKRLLEDGLELVLLVEDFAVLSGIQGHLLDAMIREAIRDGRRELCTMRTALAVTEGRLAEETVMTRAKAKWKIQSHPFKTNPEALETFQNFVGGYLNAARLGRKRLQAAFEDRQSEDWVPDFYQEHEGDLDEASRTQLESFGFSPRNHHPLFPLNNGAIQQLAKKYLGEGQGYRFDPRALINHLLRSTIINGRPLFEKKQFPPGNWHSFDPNHLVAEVSSRIKSTPESQRTRALVFFWGNDPQIPGQAAYMEQPIYDAFHLPRVDWDAKPEPPPEDVITTGTGTTVVKKEVPKKESELEKLLQLLKDWRSGKTLKQTDADKLRGFLVDAVNVWLDADELLVKKVAIGKKDFFLPYASTGNPTDLEKAVVAATEEDLSDTTRSNRFFLAMEAVVRFHTLRSWDFDGGENAFARYANFIEGLANQAKKRIVNHGATSLSLEAMKPIAQSLLIGARILSLPGATSNTDEENLAAMLDPGAQFGGNSGSEWDELKALAQAARVDLRGALLENLSARQGGGGEQAVDAARLLEYVKELRKQAWQLPKDLDLKSIDHLGANAKRFVGDLKRNLHRAVEARSEDAAKWVAEVTESCGEEFDVQDTVDNLRSTVNLALKTSMFRWRDTNPDPLRRMFSEIIKAPVKQTYDDAKKASSPEAEFGAKLSAVAHLDDRTKKRFSDFLNDVNLFLKKTEATVKSKMQDSIPNLDETAEELESVFKDFLDQWKEISQTARHD